MTSVNGKSIINRVAIGKLFLHKRNNFILTANKVNNPEAEMKRLELSLVTAKEQLNKLYEETLSLASEKEAAIFEIHGMMLDDEDYLDSIKDLINDKHSAEYAVYETSISFENMFSSMDDEYMQNRSDDVKDISMRLIQILSGEKNVPVELTEPVILLADELTPSETVRMNKDLLLGFVTKGGSVNSHTAILARTMGIPALIGIPVDESWDGISGAIDGYNGVLHIEPDNETLAYLQNLHEKEMHEREAMNNLRMQTAITSEGKSIMIYANAGSKQDVISAMKNGAEGIGLFRSEFLYLESGRLPTEDEQFNVYKDVVETMENKRVIFRTLDIGADKQVGYLNLDKEENPALGCRAIRICLTNQDIFRTQLRAILRTSSYGKIAIMFPMIISLQELLDAKRILNECKENLIAADICINDFEVGIMIETPAAVMIADDLAKEADFFSIGTNDLTQYTLAVDRQNQRLDSFYNPHHPAVLKMIQMTVEAAHRHGRWVGICGELAADLSLTEVFLEMGIDELSVAPPSILPLRAKIIQN